ncbi:MAG: hypothetical protein SZ59_C0003G0048 [candidate division TM6 bacterium GW2011_GWF2_28_16]|nr:MAG: hypothetical protein SZ59_C0003G0048 [candidate division TM6 bacterium GW2011_GWF2_28_16]
MFINLNFKKINKTIILIIFVNVFFIKNNYSMFGNNEPYSLGKTPEEPILELFYANNTFETISQKAQKNISELTKKIEIWTEYIAWATERIKYLEKTKTNNLVMAKASLNFCIEKVTSYKNELLNQREKLHEAENHNLNLKALDEKNKIMAEENDKERQNKIKIAVDSVKEVLKIENLKNISAATGLAVGLSTAAYYTSKLGYNYIESLMGQPVLVRESNKINFKNTLKNFWLHKIMGHPLKEENLEEIILSPELKTTLSNFAYDTKATHANGLNYRNTIFFGVPGTGKTMFAKRLAKYCNMDYAILSGADFAQFEHKKAIQEMHKLFDWAKRSSKGLIIFIDEADALLRNRKDLDSNRIDLVNAFLSNTGDVNNKTMIILATNHATQLDPAVLSRMDTKINFNLPGQEERKQIINLYLKKYITDYTKIVKINNQKVERKLNMSPEIDQTFVKNLAQITAGLSGRDLSQAVLEMQISAYNRGNGILTKELANTAIDRKIKENTLIAVN